MKKLKLKHITSYLPYGIKVISNERYENEIALITSLNYGLDQDLIMLQGNTKELDFFEDELEKIKPILRPLSDLTKEIKYNLELEMINYLPFVIVQELFKWHFDVFNLIDKDLAIDINNLK